MIEMRCRALLLVVATAAACAADEGIPGSSVTYTETREACAQQSPLRQVYFGDLHFHSARSWDAYGYELTVTPDETYAFARGGSVRLPPLDAGGRGTRQARQERPLDFAALTDHSEFLGETRICTTAGLKGHESGACQAFRLRGQSAVAGWGLQLVAPQGAARISDVCGADGARCVESARTVWQEIRGAAERAYDRRATCSFASFVGYEHTATPKVTNLHRNVIFRNAEVVDVPVTYYEAPEALTLWRKLSTQCLDGEKGCDVLVIPHNSNSSNGAMFPADLAAAASGTSAAEVARLRGKLEPVMELFQHKGDMECLNGLSGSQGSTDPLCQFEKVRFPPIADCGSGVGWGGMNDIGCLSRRDFLRGILLEGLALAGTLGENPYRLGVIGSTDSHNGTPGNTVERGWPGHVGTTDDGVEERLGAGNVTHRGLVNNPGGLAAVWAVERSRDAIFQALRRREVYATSGTRIEVRFFGGWDLPDDLCATGDVVETGYRRGVPMGQVLGDREGAEAPVFVVRARHDPGTVARPGTQLEQVQIVKGWIDSSGRMHHKVFVVAGKSSSGATVDLTTCRQSGPGATSLCAVWRDPEFDTSVRAFYYARVLENPSCRWSAWECSALPAAARPAGCSDANVQRAIQERAWTSPIWYEPD